MIARAVVRACLVTMTATLWACAPASAMSAASAAHAAPRAPTTAMWKEARARLAALRDEARAPRTLNIQLSLREPVSGRVLEARGAVAVAPPSGLRMILLGPGGTTALDLWIEGERYRFAVPAIDLLRRGDAGAPRASRASRRGLPVDFLRWWLLRPAEGTLLWTEHARSGDRYVLRDGDAIVDLRAQKSGAIEARRTSWSSGAPREIVDDETVVADRIGCGRVRYRQASTGLEVTVTCEGERLGPPSPRALVDPDGGEP